MTKTVKFAVSMSATEFKELESMRRKKGVTRSQFIRDAVRAWKEQPFQPLEIKEDTAAYKKEMPTDLIDLKEQRRRAIEASGRFNSGVADLSTNHDRYLEQVYSSTLTDKDKKRKRKISR